MTKNHGKSTPIVTSPTIGLQPNFYDFNSYLDQVQRQSFVTVWNTVTPRSGSHEPWVFWKNMGRIARTLQEQNTTVQFIKVLKKSLWIGSTLLFFLLNMLTCCKNADAIHIQPIWITWFIVIPMLITSTCIAACLRIPTGCRGHASSGFMYQAAKSSEKYLSKTICFLNFMI